MNETQLESYLRGQIDPMAQGDVGAYYCGHGSLGILCPEGMCGFDGCACCEHEGVWFAFIPSVQEKPVRCPNCEADAYLIDVATVRRALC